MLPLTKEGQLAMMRSMATFIVELETVSLQGSEPSKERMLVVLRSSPGLSISPRGDGSFVATVEIKAVDRANAEREGHRILVSALAAAGRSVQGSDISTAHITQLDRESESSES
jgi:hypothetical protein